MQQLSPNFAREEFELEGPMPEESVESYTFLCVNILEPIRRQFGEPMEVTSGHRNEEGNEAAGGDVHSEHVSTKDYCAADWTMPRFQKDLRGVFDWIRLNSGLTFHNVVLEHGAAGDIIHISWNRNAQVRIAKERATHNASEPIGWTVA